MSTQFTLLGRYSKLLEPEPNRTNRGETNLVFSGSLLKAETLPYLPKGAYRIPSRPMKVRSLPVFAISNL